MTKRKLTKKDKTAKVDKPKVEKKKVNVKVNEPTASTFLEKGVINIDDI